MFVNLHCLYYYRDTSTVCIHTCSKCLLLLASYYGKYKVFSWKMPIQCGAESIPCTSASIIETQDSLECEQLSPALASPCSHELAPFSFLCWHQYMIMDLELATGARESHQWKHRIKCLPLIQNPSVVSSRIGPHESLPDPWFTVGRPYISSHSRCEIMISWFTHSQKVAFEPFSPSLALPFFPTLLMQPSLLIHCQP